MSATNPDDARQMECAAVRARPVARSWDADAVDALVDEADQLAAEAHEALVRDHGSRKPEEYLPGLGLKIKVIESSDRWPTPYFSLYDGAARTVELNTKLIDDVSRFLKQRGRTDRAAHGRLRQTAIAHEIYHHLVPRPVAKSWRQRFFGVATDARTDLVEEIAAVRFSQLLAGIDFSPLEYPAAAKELSRTRPDKSTNQPAGVLSLFKRPTAF